MYKPRTHMHYSLYMRIVVAIMREKEEEEIEEKASLKKVLNEF